MKHILLITCLFILNVIAPYAQNNTDLKIKETFDNFNSKEVQKNTLTYEYTNGGFISTLTEGWGTDIISYINLYKTTYDKAYIIKAINNSLEIEYDRRDVKFPSTDATNKCWTYKDMPEQNGESQENIIHKNGRALWGLSELVYLIKHDNDLYSTILPQVPMIINNPFSITFTTYGDFAIWLQSKLEETIDFINTYYWSDDGVAEGNEVGFLNYDQSSMNINMQATYGSALVLMGILLADDNNQIKGQSYIDKALKIVDLFKNYPLRIHNNGGSCNGFNYDNCDKIIYPLMTGKDNTAFDDVNSYYWFASAWRESNSNTDCWAHRIQCTDLYDHIEDISHAIYTLTLPLTLTDYYSMYSPIDASQMVKFKNTFTKHVHIKNSNSFWSSVIGNNNVTLGNDLYGSPDAVAYTKYSNLAWMPLYKYTEQNDGADNVYDILMNFYKSTINNINPTNDPFNNDPEFIQFFRDPQHLNYFGLSEVVKAQWEKECPDLTLRNRDVVYDQDFFSKNDLIVDASLPNPFDPDNVNNSFAEPVIDEPEFIIEENVTCNMKASNSIQLKPGFHAKAGCTFHAYIEPSCFPLPSSVRITNEETDTSHVNEISNIVSKVIAEPVNTLTVLPNPNDGNMQVVYEIAENEKGILEIYDIFGKSLITFELPGSNNTFQINASTLKDGIYFYSVTAGNELVVSGKIVVIK